MLTNKIVPCQEPLSDPFPRNGLIPLPPIGAPVWPNEKSVKKRACKNPELAQNHPQIVVQTQMFFVHETGQDEIRHVLRTNELTSGRKGLRSGFRGLFQQQRPAFHPARQYTNTEKLWKHVQFVENN